MPLVGPEETGAPRGCPAASTVHPPPTTVYPPPSTVHPLPPAGPAESRPSWGVTFLAPGPLSAPFPLQSPRLSPGISRVHENHGSSCFWLTGRGLLTIKASGPRGHSCPESVGTLVHVPLCPLQVTLIPGVHLWVRTFIEGRLGVPGLSQSRSLGCPQGRPAVATSVAREHRGSEGFRVWLPLCETLMS